MVVVLSDEEVASSSPDEELAGQLCGSTPDIGVAVLIRMVNNFSNNSASESDLSKL
jgi:hypothetical protein